MKKWEGKGKLTESELLKEHAIPLRKAREKMGIDIICVCVWKISKNWEKKMDLGYENCRERGLEMEEFPKLAGVPVNQPEDFNL